MELDHDTCYQAILSHDPRFDGVFFVGVATTAIYCRTVCTARRPRRGNCTFFPSAAAAERAGYRPCLRCRPEVAPGTAHVDSASRLAAAALSRVEDGALGEMRVPDLAAELGVTDRHLRRVVQEAFGVSPIELAQTQRLLFAKRLLTDTDLPVAHVAFASGFASLRRFNSLFRDRYRLNPTALRRTRGAAPAGETVAFEMAYRPPLDWEALCWFVGARAAAGVEAVDGGKYLRTVAAGDQRGWMAVGPAPTRHALVVELSASLAPALLPIAGKVRSLFDLAARPDQIADRLGDLAAGRPGLRVPGAFDGFEMAARAVLGQQVSVKAATTLAGRFVRAFGEPMETPVPGLTHLSPTPERVARARAEDITALGVVPARANALLALARAVVEGTILLAPRADVARTTAALVDLPGIGEWTAQYIAMRALAWPDAFPHTDLGVRRALGEDSPGRILAMAEAWRPWRAYAVMHLWKSQEERR